MASKYLQKFPIPKDFPNILHDFTRDLIYEQPKDLIEFSYKYFLALENGQMPNSSQHSQNVNNVSGK